MVIYLNEQDFFSKERHEKSFYYFEQRHAELVKVSVVLIYPQAIITILKIRF